MSRRALLAAAAAALAPAGAIAVAHADGSNPHPRAARAVRTLELVARATGGGAVDNKPQGISPGDQFFEHGRITDPAGRRLGSFTLTTELVAGTASHGSEQSTVIVFLHGGQLVTTGGHATVARFSMAVVGGTGRYAGARGTVHIVPGPHGSERATVRLAGPR